MISIIIPFDKGEQYLKKCLENISKLQCEDFEVILIDDFSEDNSKNIAKEYMNKLNIKYYKTQERTIGVGNARNLGIQKANGKYIMFVDVDDTIEEDLLIKLERYVKQNVEMIKYKMKIVGNKKVILTKGPNFDITIGEDGFNQLCFKDVFLDSPCLYLIKKELLDRVNLRFEKNVYHEDFGFIPQLIVNAKSIVSVDVFGYNYIQSNNSIMRNSDYGKKIKKVEDKFLHYDNLVRKISNYEITGKTKQNLLAYYTNSIILAIKELNVKDRKFFAKKLQQMELIDNLKTKNLKQSIKKLILKNKIEWYFKIERVFE